ncbi:hypothetical protein [Taibaiella koreensis]|uniref:hypothetical protein n=1 Tax=Taibaiella koreensis TaxID=1268548 RepID=UPI000E5A00D9|nr:hypothetical protein [Taibaiella koreensis]
MDADLLGRIIASLFFTAVGSLVLFFYLKNLSDLLKMVSAPNRRMPPAQVWLLLVGLLNVVLTMILPVLQYNGVFALEWLYWLCVYGIAAFVILWQFRMVYRIADSIEAEYDSRSIPIEHRPTFQTGMFMAAAKAATLIGIIPGAAIISYLANMAYLIGLVAYWVRTHKYKKELRALGPFTGDTESLVFRDL